MNNKPKRATMRLPQMSKVLRLRRRALGQYVAPPQSTRAAEAAIKNFEWSEWR
jgi:hypothetical protein